MKKLTGKKTISWEWFSFSRDFNENNKTRLQDYAIEHTEEMIAKGFTEGELFWSSGLEWARGYWKLKTKGIN